jgi:hypothetical protein
MKWISERDALIAQTLAFVQSVTGRKADFPLPDLSAPVSPAVTAEVAAIQTGLGPSPALPQPEPVNILSPGASSDVRSEIQARIANFRKHQERFEREREEYCAATLGKLRAAIGDAPPRPPAEN